MEKFMRADEVAEIVGVSLTTIRRLTMNKEIPCYKFDRAVRYKPDEIAVWLESRKQETDEKNKKTAVRILEKDSGVELFEVGEKI